MRRPTTLLSAAVCAALLAGCQTGSPWTTDADENIERIEKGRHRASIPPTCLLSTSKKLFGIGEDIRVEVRVVTPPEGKALDPYLPIKGRFRVKRDGAVRELSPPPSSARLAWAEIPVDQRRLRERKFSQTLNKVFYMRELGWYSVWWEGRDDLGHRIRSSVAWVRVMTKAPK
jgi:entry exclusion lipoprotein TrbK